MKYRIVKYIGLAGTLLVGGCSDWLDVDPKSQIKQEVLFESEAGFRDALTVYTRLWCERECTAGTRRWFF